ncbi:MAG: choice-of-anchor D domain-containing protein [Candidatus Electryonea clarkiae]|nr:choice-of-anchor D domain-containing protein [Candidatus Electryonea clarkiae]MDP8286879.1 choice-of-anchor D domain-containing protein [Candidatus Electryonea clarkiae]
MKKHSCFVQAIIVLSFMISTASAELVFESHFPWPDQLDEGGAVGIDAIEFEGEILVLVAAEANGVVLLAEDDEGDLTFVESWADEDGSDSYGVKTHAEFDDLYIYFADGENGLNIVRHHGDEELRNAGDWHPPNEWDEAYAGRIDVLYIDEHIYIFMTEESNGVVMIVEDNEGIYVLGSHWEDEDVEEGNSAQDIAAVEYGEDVYVFVADEELGLIALILNEDNELVEIDRWDDFDPENDEYVQTVAAKVVQDELIVSVSVVPGVRTFTLDDEGSLNELGEWTPDEEDHEPRFMDIVEFDEDYYILVANGQYGFDILAEDDDGELAVHEHFDRPNENDDIIDVAYLENNGIFNLYLTNLENELLVLSYPEFSHLPEIALDPDTLDFGEVIVSDSDEQNITIYNNGEYNLIITDISVEGDYFYMDFEPFFEIEPGDSLDFIVLFEPEAAGELEAELTIVSNDPENDELTVLLTGIGMPALTVTPDTLDFGEVQLDERGELIFTLFNGGSAELNISDATIEGEFFTVDFSDMVLIEPAGEYELFVTFEPEEIAEWYGTLTITSNLPDDYETVVSLYGNAIENDVGQEISGNLPSRFEIISIYPNPFNPETSIQVALPQTSELRISVYNVLGEQVAIVARGRYQAGTESFFFDGSNLSSGIYFINAIVPGRMNELKKIILLR